MGRRIRRVELLLKLPSIFDLKKIHDDQVAKAPDRTQPGIFPDGEGKLSFLLDQIEHYPLEETRRPIVNAATMMYDHLIRSHPFIDCNKRTAIMSCFETCLMNDYYLRKLNLKEEVQFAKKVAKTTIDEIGYDEICIYFEQRIIPFQKFVAFEMIGKSIQCPYCKRYHAIYPGHCDCGRNLKSLAINYHGLLRDYSHIYPIISLQRIAGIGKPRIGRGIRKRKNR